LQQWKNPLECRVDVSPSDDRRRVDGNRSDDRRRVDGNRSDDRPVDVTAERDGDHW
jgi:hypothetical protein